MIHQRNRVESLLQHDLKTGDNSTFEAIVNSMERDGQDVFQQAGSEVVLVEVQTLTGPVRINLHRRGESVDLSLWNVDGEGSATSNTMELSSWGENNRRRTIVQGSSIGRTDGGDLDISAKEFATKLSQVGLGLSNNGFKVLVP